MPYSTLHQIVAPEFTGVGELLRGANQSFNNAFASANDILGKYQEGQQNKADMSFLETIKGATDEKTLTDILSKTDFSKMTLSPEMQKVALGMRDTVLGYDSTRIQNRNNIDMNARANADENRNQTDWVYGNNARDARNAMTPMVLDAYTNGLTYGQAAQGGGAPQGDKAAYYTAELVKRGVPEHVAAGVVMNGMDESGLNPAAIGDNGNAGGIFQWNGPRFRGLQAYARDQGRDWKDEQVQLDYFMVENQGSQKDAWSRVVNSQNPQEAAVNFLNHWERPAEQHRATREAKYSGATGGAIPTAGGYTGGQANTFVQSPAMIAAANALKANPYLDPNVAMGFMDTLMGGMSQGQDLIAARDTADQALRVAAAQNAIVTDPNLMTDAQRQAAALTAPGLNPVSRQAAATGVNTMAAPGGAAGALATPAVGPDAVASTLADAANARTEDALATDPANVALRTVKQYEAADDPVAKLIADTNENVSIIGDGLSDNKTTRDTIQAMADEARVSVPEMAATLAEMVDTTSIKGEGTTATVDQILKDYRRGTDEGSGLWRLLGHVGTGNPVEEAKKRFGPGAKYASDNANAAAAGSKQQVSSIQNQITALRSQQEKLKLVDPKSPEIAQIESKINGLTMDLNVVATPTGAEMAKLMLVPRGTPEYTSQRNAFVTALQADKDPSLTPTIRQQLLSRFPP